MDVYKLLMVLAGLAALGAAVLPRLLSDRPLSVPIVYVAAGMGMFALPLGLAPPDPLAQGELTEHLTEFGVIVALMGAGLKLERALGWRRWRTVWMLLAVTMPISIGLAALLGWWAVGLAPATALLVGAALAPTDPVLAADVQVAPPGEGGREDEVRFALTAEAGLNDGLAFPFVHAAVAMAAAAATAGGSGAALLGEWFAVDVLWKLGVGVGMGFVVGRALAWLLIGRGRRGRLAGLEDGFLALAATLLTYGLTELAYGYGFLAVFVAGLTLRRSEERGHDYHRVLHGFVEEVERLSMIALLVIFGGALIGGLLAPLTWPMALAGLAVVLVVRPAAGWIAARGVRDRGERAAIAFFGVRGIGSFYYLSYGLNEADFPGAEQAWALVAFVVLVSVVVHGITSTAVLGLLDRRRRRARRRAAVLPVDGQKQMPDVSV